MRIPNWLLRLLPMWDYVCPKCQKDVPKNSHECPHCGERYPLPLKLPSSMLNDRKAMAKYVHEHIFPRVSAQQRRYLARFFTRLFSDGFESGDASAWSGTDTSTGGTVTFSSSLSHHGTYSALCEDTDYGGGAVVYRSLGSHYSELYARGYFRFANDLPGSTGEYIDLIVFRDLEDFVDRATVQLTYDGSNVILRLDDGSNTDDGSTVITTDQWYCIELHADYSSGDFDIKLDGSEEASISSGVTGEVASSVYMGMKYGNKGSGETFSVYLDCCVISDSEIGEHEVFSDGFESNDFLAWDDTTTNGDATIGVQSSIVRNGVYSSHVSLSSAGDWAHAYKNISGNHLYFGEYVRFTALPATNQSFYLLQIIASGNLIGHVAIYNDGGTYKWGFRYRTNDSFPYVYSTMKTPAVDTWYWVEWEVDLCSSDGTADGNYRLYIDGDLLTDISQEDVDTDYTDISVARMSRFYTSAALTVDAYFDRCIISDAYIGPESEETTLVEVADSLSLSDVVTVSSESSSTWNGGTVTNDIIIEKATPVLQLKNTSANPELHFNDGDNLMKIYGSTTTSPHLVVDSDITLEQDVDIDGSLDASSLKIGGTEVINSSRQITAVPPLVLNFASADTNTNEIQMGKAGSPASDNVLWNFSVRSNNTDFWLYGYDGTFIRNFLKCSWDEKTVELQSQGLVIGDAKLYCGVSKHLHTDSDLTVSGTLYTLEEVKLSGDSIPTDDKQSIVDKIWKYVDGMWAPEGLEPGDSFLNFRDSTVFTEQQFFLITEEEGEEVESLLATNTGFIVQKDISAGGFVGSNQGELWLGSGRDNQVDVPKIVLMHSDEMRTGGLPTCTGDNEFPQSASEGDYFFHTGQNLLYKYNGSSWDNITVKGQLFILIGAPVLLYSCTSYNPQTQVASWATDLASNYTGYFDTLYLTKYDTSTLANLKCDFVYAAHVYTDDIKRLDGTTFDFGETTWNGGTVTIDIIPSGTVDLGSEENAFDHLYVSHGYVGTLDVTAEAWINLIYSHQDQDLVLYPYSDYNVNIAQGGLEIGGTLVLTSARKLQNIASTDLVTNLNADMLDGHHWSEISWSGGTVTSDIIPSGTVNLGSSGSLFNALYVTTANVSYGNMGYLNVTNEAYINIIYSHENQDLVLYPYSGYNVNISQGGLEFGGTEVISSSRAIDNVTSIDMSGVLHCGGGIEIDSTANIITDNASMYFYKADSSGYFYFRHGTPSSYLTLFQVDNAGTGKFAGNLYVGGRKLYAVGSTLRSSSWFVVEDNLTVTDLTSASTAIGVDGYGTLGTLSSTIRLKQDIEPCLDCSWVYDLQPVYFNWKDEERHKQEGRQLGMIAEQVNEVYPSFVFRNKAGEIEGYHRDRLGIPILVELKKLRDRIVELESQVDALTSTTKVAD